MLSYINGQTWKEIEDIWGRHLAHFNLFASIVVRINIPIYSISVSRVVNQYFPSLSQWTPSWEQPLYWNKCLAFVSTVLERTIILKRNEHKLSYHFFCKENKIEGSEKCYLFEFSPYRMFHLFFTTNTMCFRYWYLLQTYIYSHVLSSSVPFSS